AAAESRLPADPYAAGDGAADQRLGGAHQRPHRGPAPGTGFVHPSVQPDRTSGAGAAVRLEPEQFAAVDAVGRQSFRRGDDLANRPCVRTSHGMAPEAAAGLLTNYMLFLIKRLALSFCLLGITSGVLLLADLPRAGTAHHTSQLGKKWNVHLIA